MSQLSKAPGLVLGAPSAPVLAHGNGDPKPDKKTKKQKTTPQIVASKISMSTTKLSDCGAWEAKVNDCAELRLVTLYNAKCVCVKP